MINTLYNNNLQYTFLITDKIKVNKYREYLNVIINMLDLKAHVESALAVREDTFFPSTY